MAHPQALQAVVELSAYAAILIALVLLLRWTLRRQLSPRWKCALWALVALRLLTPGLIPISLPTTPPTLTTPVTHSDPVPAPETPTGLTITAEVLPSLPIRTTLNLPAPPTGLSTSPGPTRPSPRSSWSA